MTLKAAIYTRLSHQDREAGGNIKEQVQTCRDYAEAHDLDIVAEYQDDGVSGAKISRPGLNDAIAAAEEGAFEALIVRSHTRFSRDTTAAGMLQDIFERAGVTLHYVNLGGPVDRTTSSGVWVDGLMKVKAEAERADIRDRTMRGRYRRAKLDKVMIGGNVAYGYKRVRHFADQPKLAYTSLEVIKAEAIEVRRIFKAFLGGADYSELAARLNERKVPRHQLGEWEGRHIKDILVRPDYAGVRYYGRQKAESFRDGMEDKTKRWFVAPDHEDVVRQKVEGIVDPDMWHAVQARVVSVSRRSARRMPAETYLLRNRISCAKCGGAYWCKTYIRSNGRHLYRYRHNDRNKECANTSLSFYRDRLEDRIKAQLGTLLMVPEEEWERIAEDATNRMLEETEGVRSELEAIDKALAALEHDLTKARRLMLDEVFTADDYASERKRIGQEVASLERERGELDQGEPTYWEIEGYYSGRLQDLHWQAETLDLWTPEEWFEAIDRNDVTIEVLEPADTELGGRVHFRSLLADAEIVNGNGVQVEVS